ncbi:NAD-dependent protein deacylase [Hylemonella gracilis str. Niagara R]|uniref:protein acetyllysine N-acetyltransferase n=1 Tax=Hylemonella gracilis str. Niagara R TaxID=1458275 RepID=A0A016XFU2_9BURK|nr:NAD-dependent deacylase [Hylemonella gracilis]EYC50038.1 NAD-dependent protein deacylase [Hylemonella gracilis str. Niagara R]
METPRKPSLVVFTGAGISAESGLATFRDANGLWNSHRPEELASIQAWRRDPALVLEFYNQRWKQLQTVKPNSAHYAIAELEQAYDVTVITQNVDDLHERAGSTKIVHLHGELMKVCEQHDKGATYPYANPLKVEDLGPTGRQLRPFIVWFGEDVPLIPVAQEIVSKADVFIVVGTSLNVYPAASLVDDARRASPKFLVNKEHSLGTLGLDRSVFEDWTVLIGPATVGMSEVKHSLLTKRGKSDLPDRTRAAQDILQYMQDRTLSLPVSDAELKGWIEKGRD